MNAIRVSIFDAVGSKCSAVKNVNDALNQIGANFEPLKVSTFYQFNDKVMKGDKMEIIRSDNGKSLGTMGEGYHACSNSIAFDILNQITRETGAIFERGGEIKNKYFLSVKLPYSIAPKKNPKDVTELYFTAFNSFDGSTGIVYAENSIRIVCQNTFKASLNTGFSKIRHSALAQQKIDDVKLQIAFAIAEKETLQNQINVLYDRSMTSREMTAFSYKLLNIKDGEETTRQINKSEQLVGLFSRGMGNEGRNAYDALNAVTEYADFYSTSKETEGNSRAVNKFESGFLGPNNALKSRAMELLLN